MWPKWSLWPSLSLSLFLFTRLRVTFTRDRYVDNKEPHSTCYLTPQRSFEQYSPRTEADKGVSTSRPQRPVPSQEDVRDFESRARRRSAPLCALKRTSVEGFFLHHFQHFLVSLGHMDAVALVHCSLPDALLRHQVNQSPPRSPPRTVERDCPVSVRWLAAGICLGTGSSVPSPPHQSCNMRSGGIKCVTSAISSNVRSERRPCGT